VPVAAAAPAGPPPPAAGAPAVELIPPAPLVLVAPMIGDEFESLQPALPIANESHNNPTLCERSETSKRARLYFT